MGTRKSLVLGVIAGTGLLLCALAPTAGAVSYPTSTFQLTVQSPADATEMITFTGSSQIIDGFLGPDGAANDTGGNGLDDVKIQITSLSMTGTSTALGFGAGTMHLSPIPSTGRLEETINSTPGLMDMQPFRPGNATSFFDVFFELDFPGVTFHNGIGEHVSDTLTFWAPGVGDSFVSSGGIVDLLDPNGLATGYHVTSATYIPGPVPEPSLLWLVGLGLAPLGAASRVTRRAQ